MGTLRIAAKSIDELNFLYRKVRKDYKPQGTIRLNQESLEYELELLRNEMDPALKAICEKVMDMLEMWEGEFELQLQEENDLDQLMNNPVIAPPMRPLQNVWKSLTSDKRHACYQYLYDQINESKADDFRLAV